MAMIGSVFRVHFCSLILLSLFPGILGAHGGKKRFLSAVAIVIFLYFKLAGNSPSWGWTITCSRLPRCAPGAWVTGCWGILLFFPVELISTLGAHFFP